MANLGESFAFAHNSSPRAWSAINSPHGWEGNECRFLGSQKDQRLLQVLFRKNMCIIELQTRTRTPSILRHPLYLQLHDKSRPDLFLQTHWRPRKKEWNNSVICWKKAGNGSTLECKLLRMRLAFLPAYHLHPPNYGIELHLLHRMDTYGPAWCPKPQGRIPFGLRKIVPPTPTTVYTVSVEANLSQPKPTLHSFT